MYRYKKYINLLVFLIIVGLSYQTFFYPVAEPFESESIPVMQQEDALYQEIQNKSSTYSMPPEDAYIDEVWKKTPGRNGLEVNIEKSYENMKKEGTFNDDLLVYDQHAPKVSLKDLPPSPIFRGHPEKEMVSLLINVSWGEEHIPKILNTLKEYNVKATFFIEGKWAQNNSELVKMIDEQGHVIGNHAYNHPNMERLSYQQMTEQIRQTNDILSAITGDKPKWFAPPAGSYNDQVVQSAHNLNMETVLWTVDTIDWKNPSVSVMINRINDKLHPGATILMHPTPAIAEGLSSIIQTTREKGYKIGDINRLTSEER